MSGLGFSFCLGVVGFACSLVEISLDWLGCLGLEAGACNGLFVLDR